MQCNVFLDFLNFFHNLLYVLIHVCLSRSYLPIILITSEIKVLFDLVNWQNLYMSKCNMSRFRSHDSKTLYSFILYGVSLWWDGIKISNYHFLHICWIFSSIQWRMWNFWWESSWIYNLQGRRSSTKQVSMAGKVPVKCGILNWQQTVFFFLRSIIDYSKQNSQDIVNSLIV